jgi:hypothetical protein
MKWTIGTGAATMGSAKRLFVILAGMRIRAVQSGECRDDARAIRNRPAILPARRQNRRPAGRHAERPEGMLSGRRHCKSPRRYS